MEAVTLKTARLVLSCPVASDVDAIVAGAQDPEVPRWTTLPSPYTRSDGDEFVGKAAEWWDAGAELVWAIRQGGEWIGMIGLHHVTHGDAEIGYWMTAAARGKGLLTEAGRAVVEFAFSADGADLTRLEWRALVGNEPSARSARTLGFRYEGLLRSGLSSPRGRSDGWIAGLLATDDRSPTPWSVLGD